MPVLRSASSITGGASSLAAALYAKATFLRQVAGAGFSAMKRWTLSPSSRSYISLTAPLLNLTKTPLPVSKELIRYKSMSLSNLSKK